MQHKFLFRRLTALIPAVGIFLSFAAPAAALPSTRVGTFSRAAAVSCPAHPAGDYILACAQLAPSKLDRQQVNALWNRTSADLTSRLKTGSLSAEELRHLCLPHYHQELAERYAACAPRYPGLSPTDIVKKVNMDLDRPFYVEPEPVSDPDTLTVLVNKYHGLSADYVPALEALGSGYGVGSLRPEAAAQFRAMADAAARDGLSLRSVSAYRSYQRQTTLYNQYLATDSRRSVDRYSARPGYSEHQTGLAVDINAAGTSARFQSTPEYAWLVAHCAEFGFILRYPQGKEAITGYKFESWHYRYVGREIAQICMSRGLTYEEFLALQPAAEANALPVLSYRGGTIDLSGEAVYLNGMHYLPADTLVQALGGTSAPAGGETLSLSLGERQASLHPGDRYTCGGQEFALSSPALSIHGTLYLTLPDLCTVLGLGARSAPSAITLFSLYQS